ncbi:hypothetical protein DFH94DRAFT_3546 [Russula ochroleuca]|jgi:hypothetical protein|uniref:Uncharacterized protein n=1 Tax=Russula ochroleuca TaxID=152965 RepID=A0A9P5N522_9AGAM|nr:hypothetical protein DFH94DRAFT_3546 [Russula ochroleuca]
MNEFEKRAGTNLIQHQIIDKLRNCDSADSVIEVLQEQAQAFRNFRGDDGKLMTWLKQTVDVLYSLSTSEVLGGAIGLVCLPSWHTQTQRDTFFSIALPSSKGNIRWTCERMSGVDINSRDDIGQTPIQVVARNEQVASGQMLLTNGAKRM